MNCPECGHPIEIHTSALGCLEMNERGLYCTCQITLAEFERDAWRAEALAARELIDTVISETHMIGPRDIPNNSRLLLAYLAARVKDGA